MSPKPGDPTIMGTFLCQHPPMREALPLPHIASLTCFRSPSKSQSASPIPRPVPPTPRKMSSIPVVKIQADGNRSRRRRSSIPRPTSAIAHSPKKPRLGTPTSTSSSVSLQKSTPSVHPRTYSRTQRSSIPSEKPTPPLSYEFHRALPPRSDSLLSYNSRPANHDLSGVRQQLQIRNYSTQSLASIDATLSSRKNRTSTSLPLPAQRRLSKSKTSTSLTKPALNLTPQRQLMKPIDPPLPRSQTMGSLWFAGDGTKETPSPVKSDSNSDKVGNGTELCFTDVLQESRMTEYEVEVYKQVTRETQLNKQRMQRIGSKDHQYSTADAREFLDSFSRTTNLILPQAESILSPIGASTRFGKINVTKNEEMDRKLLRRDKDHRRDDRRLHVDGTGSRGLHVDTNLANMIQRTPMSLTTPDSGMSFGSNPDDEWEVNVKLVYFRQELPYWTGRFSTLCDRLKTADAHLVSSHFGVPLASSGHQGGLETEESFEVAEHRRMKYALEELRSYCRTNAALCSFEEFETHLLEHLDKRAEAQRRLAQGPLICSTEEVILGIKQKPESKPKLGWHFGQSQISNIADKAIATGSAIASKQKQVMIKSKTTSNLASGLHGEDTMAPPSANSSSIGDAKSLPGLTWQRPTVQEAQAQAKRIREQRVFAKAVTYRRASGQDSGVGKGWSYKTAARQDSGVGRAWTGGDGVPTNSENSAGSGIAEGWPGNEPPTADGKPTAKGGHSRKSSGAEALSLKKVFSGSMKGVRKMRRSFTGSGSVSGNERVID